MSSEYDNMVSWAVDQIYPDIDLHGVKDAEVKAVVFTARLIVEQWSRKTVRKGF